MIRWLIQTVVDHPDLSARHPPAGLLTPIESAQYRGFLSPRRRRDWLLGRWTAKRLAQAHVAATDGFRPAYDSFMVEYDASGAPYIASQHPTQCNACNTGRVPVALSISHSNGYAFCALAENEAGTVRVGADIELVETRPDSFAQDFFTATEQASIEVAPPPLRDLLITATWSAKEAILKTTHLALRADPHRVECIVRPTHPHHWTPLRVEMDPALRAQARMIGPLRLWWRVIDNRLRPGTSFVLTLAANGMTL